MKRTIFHLAAWAVWGSAVHGQEPVLPRFVGESTCRTCHSVQGGTKQCCLEPIPRHSRAHDLLRTTRAREIAAISGIGGRPTDTRVCLECHSAGADEGPRWWEPTFEPSEGVQCESCHGPGSEHIRAMSVTKSGDSATVVRSDPTRCTLCHIDRPSHREVIQNGFSRQPADFAYKSPVDVVVSDDGTRLYVVCEHSDSVLIVDAGDGFIVSEAKVGRRPKSAALDPNGRWLYVTNAFGGTLSVVDVHKGRETEQIKIGAEPHGLTLDVKGGRLYVLNTGEDTISVVDVHRRLEEFRLVAGAGPWSAALQSSGELAAATSVRPNRGRFRESTVSELTYIDVNQARVVERVHIDGANMMQGIAWVPGTDIALATLTRTKNLVPATRLAQGWMITYGLAVLRPGGRVDQVLVDQPDEAFPDLAEVAVSPDGRWALITVGGGDEAIVVDVQRLLEFIDGHDSIQRAEVLPDHLGSSRNFLERRIPVGANPRGAAFSPDGHLAYVCNTLSDSVSAIDTTSWTVARTILLGGPVDTTVLRKGEKLFHNADITRGRQFSCRSCHPDGHHNGLTFDIEADGPGMKPLDNRTLRGIFDTGPFKWEGTNPSLPRQCGARFAVFFTRQAPYSPDDLDALVHYIATIERPPNRFRSPDGLTLAQRRGKAIFERSTSYGAPLRQEDRCNFCHVGAYRTNRQKAAVATTMWFDATVDVDLSELFNTNEFGELGNYYFLDAGMPSVAWDVPHLTDIASSAPYLHNGAAQTLEEIWTRFNMVNHHGASHGLTKQEINDLIAYLKAQ